MALFNGFFLGRKPVETSNAQTHVQIECAKNLKKFLVVGIRWMIRADLPRVMAIERGAFWIPWQRWEDTDQIHFSAGKCAIAMVAEFGDTLVGFMCYELSKSHVELIRIAVHPAFQGMQVGRQLISKLQAKCFPEQRKKLIVCVPEENLPMQKFLRALGIRAMGMVNGPEAEKDQIMFVWENGN